jgi:hypothetical protein
VFAYVRAGSILVLLNFSTDVVEYTLPHDIKVDSAILETEKGGVEVKDGVVVLQAYSGALYRITG